MTLIILDHIEPSDSLSDLYDRMSDEATRWNKAYHESGKRGAELTECDIAFAVANMYAKQQSAKIILSRSERVVILASALVDVREDPESLKQAIALLTHEVKLLDADRALSESKESNDAQ